VSDDVGEAEVDVAHCFGARIPKEEADYILAMINHRENPCVETKQILDDALEAHAKTGGHSPG